jgi:periplasmic copper chaperone A
MARHIARCGAFFIQEMSMKRILCAGLLAMLAVTPAFADDVKVIKAWTRATAPGQDSASVQLTITSKKDATLIGVASGSAQSGEIHTMVMEGDVMKMRAIESLPLPAKTPVTLGADGNHVMLIGLKKPLRAGHKLPFALTVKLADGKTVVLKELAVIKPLETTSDEGHEHHHH